MFELLIYISFNEPSTALFVIKKIVDCHQHEVVMHDF